jgi:hypothetical protein
MIQFHQYFQTGGRELKAQLERAGEPPIPAVGKFLDKATAMNISELVKYNM